jgi:hypothetical protein
MVIYGASGRSRTDTSLRIPDFESGASTSSTTEAIEKGLASSRPGDHTDICLSFNPVLFR